MAEEMSQEQMLEQQKANCIFCKIIKGEMPSKTVYEDDKMVAILDIRPAVKGHCLVMLREHYPIMPLIPPEEFAHLFGTTAAFSGALRDGMLAQRCTTFIANGAIAGQQSPHFLFHMIPREDGDGLQKFDIPQKGVEQQDIVGLLQQNLSAIMQQHLQKTGKSALGAAPAPGPSQPPPPNTPEPEDVPSQPAEQPAPQQIPVDRLAAIIEQNPELKALLINNPEKLEAIVEQNPQFKQLFAGVDLKKLGHQLQKIYLDKQEAQASEPEMVPEPEPSPEPSPELHEPEPTPEFAAPEPTQQNNDDVKPAMEMTMQELFAYIDQKPRLRKLMIEAPSELKRMIPDNDRLSKFFAGCNLNAIIQAYQEHAKANHGVRVTMEPGDAPVEEPVEQVRKPKGPSREQSQDAWDEVRGMDETRRKHLDRIGRLFK